MAIICPFCSNKIDENSKLVYECGNCQNIFPDFKSPYSDELWKSFIESYLNFIPKVFPFTVVFEMKKYFDTDLKRIFHALNVANYAHFIAKKEDADIEVVLCCGYLHDIGIKNSELKYNSSAPKYQEIEGPPVAKEILENLEAKENLIEEVCDIIAHHHSPRESETKNFMCLYDADLIVNWLDGIKERNVKVKNIDKILNLFYTDTGKQILINIAKNYAE